MKTTHRPTLGHPNRFGSSIFFVAIPIGLFVGWFVGLFGIGRFTPPHESLFAQGASATSGESNLFSPLMQLPTPNTTIAGTPLTVEEILAGTHPPNIRCDRMIHYWGLVEKLAFYNLAITHAADVEACIARHGAETIPQNTAATLLSARRIAAQEKEFAAIALAAEQFAIAGALGEGEKIAEPKNLPLPTTPPTLAPYQTRFDDMNQSRRLSTAARMYDQTIPLQYEAVVARQAEVTETLTAFATLYRIVTTSDEYLLTALERHSSAKRKMILAVIAYNRMIASYVAETVGPGVEGNRLVRTFNILPHNEVLPYNDISPYHNAATAPSVRVATLPPTLDATPRTEVTPAPPFPAASPEAALSAAPLPAHLAENVSDAPKTETGFSRTAPNTPNEPALNRPNPPLRDTPPPIIHRPTPGTNDAETPAAPPFPESVPPIPSPSIEFPFPEFSGSSGGPSHRAEPLIFRDVPAIVRGQLPDFPPLPTGPNLPDTELSLPTGPNETSQSETGQNKVGDAAESSTSAPNFAQNPSPAATNSPPSPTSSPLATGPLGGAAPPSTFPPTGTGAYGGGAAPRETVETIPHGEPLAAPPSFGTTKPTLDDDKLHGIGILTRVLFPASPTKSGASDAQIVEIPLSLTEAVALTSDPARRLTAVELFWTLRGIIATLEVEQKTRDMAKTLFASLENSGNTSVETLALLATWRAYLASVEARIAETRVAIRVAQVDLLREANRSPENGWPIPSSFPCFGPYRLEAGQSSSRNLTLLSESVLIPEKVHALWNSGLALLPLDMFSQEMPRDKTADERKAVAINATLFTPEFDGIKTLDDAYLYLKTLDNKRIAAIGYIDQTISLNQSIARYVTAFSSVPIPNATFVQCLIGEEK